MKLADRTTRISSSPTMKVTATVDRLRREGVDVIDFGAGEPDFSTPDNAKNAGHDAITQNFTRYTPAPGIVELKRAICDRYRTDYGVDYKESEVIVTAGGKQALYNAALSLWGPGDEVITHAPYWPTRRRCSPGPIRKRDLRFARARFSISSRRAPAASS